VADSNVAAQQEGIASLCAFLKFGGREGCTRYGLILMEEGVLLTDKSGPEVIQLHRWLKRVFPLQELPQKLLP
jgi:hypothetical protein